MFNESIKDSVLAFASFFQIVVLMLQELLVSANIFTHEYFRPYSIMLSALPMVIAIVFVLERKIILFISVYFIVLLALVLTVIVFPQDEKPIKNEFFYLLCINVPCFLCLACIRDLAVFNNVLLYLSYLIFILGILYIYFIIKGRISFENYDMAFSYYLLLPALVFISRKNLIYSLFFVLICIMIIMIGSRGPLAVALIYSFYLLLIDSKSRRNILMITFLFILLIVSFLTIFVNFMNDIGISSRTLELIFEGNIAKDSNRSWVYSIIWRSILDSPVLGHGLFGDRLLLNGDYSHNIFLEIFHHFGFILGSFIILLIFYSIIKVLVLSDKDSRKLLIMLFCYCFIPFFVSKSYLKDPGLGILLGAVISISDSQVQKNTLGHSPFLLQ